MQAKKFKMLKKLIFAVVFLTSYFTTATAQVPSPQPTCVSVTPAPLGAVTITWITPAGPGAQFAFYTIYRANAYAGPYISAGTVNVFTQTSFTDNLAGANTASKYYYIQTTYNAPGPITSPPVDTVRSIFLSVAGVSAANLTWNSENPVGTPPIVTSSGVYNVFMEFPTGSGNWTLTGTTTNLNYLDTIFVCNAAINFRVEIADNTGCVSVSSVATDVFQNLIAPGVTTMDTLSVDNSNHPMMNWGASNSPDVAGYIIYQNVGGVWITVDTVFGIGNTNYTNLAGNAGVDSLIFRVAAFDSCGNIGLAGNNLQTMYLTSVADICNHSATLSWSAYPLIGNGLAGCNIFQATASAAGPYTYIGTVPPGVQTFIATGLSTSTTYYFKVDAFDFSGQNRAASNRRTFYCAAPIPPNFLYVVTTSVGASNRVDVSTFVDTAASVLGYKIMRATVNSPNGYTQVGFMGPVTYPLFMYSDYTADADNNSYFYKVINVDSCGFDGMESNIGRSIKLTATGNSDFTNTLTWNKYETWDGAVISYKIYRGLDGLIDIANPIMVIPSPFLTDEFTYVDTSVWRTLKGDGNFYYMIEAVEGAGAIFNFGATSRSNIAIAKQEPEMFIPNCFTPEAGVNVIFVPVTTWADYANYSMEIFNRFGENLFSTKKIGDGWDGQVRGKNCETGVYVYLVKYRTAKGEDIQRKGIVTLLR